MYISLLTGSTEPANYSVAIPLTNFYQNGTITSSTQNTVCLPRNLTGPSFYFPYNPQNNEYKEGVHLQTQGVKTAVIGSYINPYIDTFFAIPTVDLCVNEYIYYAVSVIGHSSTDGSVVIVGTADLTTVTIVVLVSAVIKTSHTTNWTSLVHEQSYTYQIQRQQIVYIATRGDNDLTGTKVTTNKPISLFSGHECVINNAINFCDTLIEQLPPTKLWGRVYYFTPLAGWLNYRIKIITHASTVVNISCNNTVTMYTINAGGSLSLIYSNQQYCGVFASNVVLVTQFSYWQGSESMMTLIPSTDHYTNSITSSTPNNYYSFSYNHYINIIILVGYYQPEMISITTGGVSQSLDSLSWVPIMRNNVVEAYAVQVSISQGIFKVTHADMDALMTVVVYGVAVYSSTSSAIYPSDEFPEGYGHPGWLMGQLHGMFDSNCTYTAIYIRSYICTYVATGADKGNLLKYVRM